MVINQKETTANGSDRYLKYLPSRIADAVAFTAQPIRMKLNEIRLRINSPVSLTAGGENVTLDKIADVNSEEIALCVKNLCEGSYLSQTENIKNGYIITSDGYRAGICGNLDGNADGILTAGTITSINLRVGRFMNIDAAPVINLIKQGTRFSNCGIIIFSPPAGGKSTLLKYLAYALSKGRSGFSQSYRVALIDSRCELYDAENMRGGLMDVFSGYEKSRAMETAVRVMNPEFIICDEIFGAGDFSAVSEAKNSGVSVIASAHAGSMESLGKRNGVSALIESEVFEYAVSISNSRGIFKYDVIELKEREKK